MERSEKKLFGFLLVLIALFIGYVTQFDWSDNGLLNSDGPVDPKLYSQSPEGSLSAEPQLKDKQEIVNKHLYQLSQRIAIQQGLLKNQLIKELPKQGESIFKYSKKGSEPLPFDPEGGGGTVKGLPSGSGQDGGQVGGQTGGQINPQVQPRDQVLSEVSEQELDNYSELEYRESYKQQFRKNAWGAGYEVVVDEQGIVISVRELRGSERAKPFPEDETE